MSAGTPLRPRPALTSLPAARRRAAARAAARLGCVVVAATVVAAVTLATLTQPARAAAPEEPRGGLGTRAEWRSEIGAAAAGGARFALIRLSEPVPPGGRPDGARDWRRFGARAALAVLTLPLLFWVARRRRQVNRIGGPGFEVIAPSERRRFIALEERFQALDFLSRVQTTAQLRLSANLNKVTLSIRRFGYLMEDKNYRNALLVNRRRVRRTLLRDGDVLDLGDLTLLYRDNRAAPIVRHSSITPPEGKVQIKFQRLHGPVRRGMPTLTFEGTPPRVFHVTKNKVYLGRSESNDLVIKSRNVYYRHAKLERVGGRWKLQDLSILGNTFVNNRRIEQRFLKEGDELSIESHRLRFGFVTRPLRERPPQTGSAAPGEADEAAPEALAGVELHDGGDDADYPSAT